MTLGDLELFDLAVGRAAGRLDGLVAGLAHDLDATGPHRLGNLAHEVDVQHAVLEVGTLHLDVVGEAELPTEGAGRDALVQELRAVGRPLLDRKSVV